MHTSLVRRTIDPLIAATAATLMCAVAANSQIVVSQESSENPGLMTKLHASERFVPDVVLYEKAPAAKQAVETHIINKLTKARQTTSTPKSFAQLPGHGVQ
ncbi:MAG TPA: hypothetical protein PKZ32_06940 [Candidatus Melainabacteria bacterium]|nr:hypothetical protein [Candidatus Melainabacteria bacterium]